MPYAPCISQSLRVLLSSSDSYRGEQRAGDKADEADGDGRRNDVGNPIIQRVSYKDICFVRDRATHSQNTICSARAITQYMVTIFRSPKRYVGSASNSLPSKHPPLKPAGT